jgi:hypothetical protein
MPFVLALAFSLALHVSVLVTGPFGLGDGAEGEEAEGEAIVIRAQLKAPPGAEARPAPASKPARPKPQAPAPAKPPLTPVAASEVTQSQPPQPPSEPPAPAPATSPIVEEPPAPQLTAAASLPLLAEHAELRYTVTRGDQGFVIGAARLSWSREGDAYNAGSLIETTGLAALFKSLRVTQQSKGRLDASGLHPDWFQNVQLKRTDTAVFDRVARQVDNNGSVVALDAHTGPVQDLLSMYYQLALTLKRAESLPPYIELPIATGRKLAPYRFEVLGRERIETPAGSFDALHLRARNRDDLIELWFVPEQFDAPVRLRFTDRKQDVFEQNLESVVKGNS